MTREEFIEQATMLGMSPGDARAVERYHHFLHFIEHGALPFEQVYEEKKNFRGEMIPIRRAWVPGRPAVPNGQQMHAFTSMRRIG